MTMPNNPTAGTGTQPGTPQYPSGYYVPGRQYRSRAAYVVGQSAQHVNVPRGVPQFMGNATVIIMAWGIAIAIIFWDEWKTHGVFARPSRLWWTTLVYGILAVVGMSGAVLPIANALAIGYTIVLAWQYFNGTGQFASTGGGTGGGTGGSGKK